MNIFKRKKFFIKTRLTKSTYNFCANVEMVASKAERVKHALEGKHDSTSYARMLFDEVNRHMVILIREESKLVKFDVTNTLKRIEEDKFSKFSESLADHYVSEDQKEIFKQQPEVIDMVNYSYNFTMLRLAHEKSIERLNRVNLNLIQELEPLIQYKEIKNCVNALQYLMSKLYEMRDRLIKELNEDGNRLYKRNRITKYIILKNLRKTVHQMN